MSQKRRPDGGTGEGRDGPGVAEVRGGDFFKFVPHRRHYIALDPFAVGSTSLLSPLFSSCPPIPLILATKARL